MGQDVVPRVFLAVRVWAAHPAEYMRMGRPMHTRRAIGRYTHMRQNIPNTDNYV